MWCELFVFVLAATAAVAAPQGSCGIVKPEQEQFECGRNGKIVGGCETEPNAWPWQTSLRRVSMFGQSHTCGGNLIAPNWVLTAAHCVQGNTNPTAYRADLGRHHRDNAGDNVQMKSIKRVIVHPRYNQGVRFCNDAALLELQTPVEINEYVSPVCLPLVDVYGNETGMVTGWGNIGEGVCCAYQLKQAEVPIHSQAVCRQPHVNGNLLDDSMVCAGSLLGGTSTCQGDSGGPLAYKYTNANGTSVWQVNGLTSWAYGCARPNKPTVFGRVYKFLEWIKQETGLEPPIL